MMNRRLDFMAFQGYYSHEVRVSCFSSNLHEDGELVRLPGHSSANFTPLTTTTTTTTISHEENILFFRVCILAWDCNYLKNLGLSMEVERLEKANTTMWIIRSNHWVPQTQRPGSHREWYTLLPWQFLG